MTLLATIDHAPLKRLVQEALQEGAIEPLWASLEAVMKDLAFALEKAPMERLAKQLGHYPGHQIYLREHEASLRQEVAAFMNAVGGSKPLTLRQMHRHANRIIVKLKPLNPDLLWLLSRMDPVTPEIEAIHAATKEWCSVTSPICTALAPIRDRAALLVRFRQLAHALDRLPAYADAAPTMQRRQLQCLHYLVQDLQVLRHGLPTSEQGELKPLLREFAKELPPVPRLPAQPKSFRERVHSVRKIGDFLFADTMPTRHGLGLLPSWGYPQGSNNDRSEDGPTKATSLPCAPRVR